MARAASVAVTKTAFSYAIILHAARPSDCLEASASRPVAVLGPDGRSEKDTHKPDTGHAVIKNERRLN